MLMELIESARLPVLVSTTDWEVELFIARVPKFTEVGESESLGAAFSPAPESGMRIGVFKSTEEITSEPLSSTAAGGSKTTLRVRWLPGARRTGAFAEGSENPVPDTCRLFRVIESELELITLTVWEFF
jgi:hypothetical protein